jgi:heme-degrading monooxygenase HmoA
MVRILIKRHLKASKRGELIHLLKELRTAAIHQAGYVSGETLSSIENASIISVLSTWQRLKDWKTWEESEPRIRLEQQIEPLLIEKPEVSIYEVMASE